MKENRNLLTGVGLIASFALWTVLIQCVDVQAVGQNGTKIGFADLNVWFHQLTGVHMVLYTITGLSAWIKIVFIVLIGITILNGICGVIVCHLERPVWNRHLLATGMALSVACAAVFILTRQPYAGIVCLAILVVKGLLIGKGKSLLWRK